jgi:hypothetical protein
MSFLSISRFEVVIRSERRRAVNTSFAGRLREAMSYFGQKPGFAEQIDRTPAFG